MIQQLGNISNLANMTGILPAANGGAGVAWYGYEEGSWTPTDASGAGLSLTVVADSCLYTRIGRKVWASFSFTYPTTADASATAIGGLPFTIKNVTSSGANGGSFGYSTYTASWLQPYGNVNTTNFTIRSAGQTSLTNANCSGKIFRGEISFVV